MTTPRIPIRSVLALPLLLALAGCSILGSGPASENRTTIYAPDVRVAPDPSWPSVPWSLSIATANAPRMVDSSRIAVRPTPDELQVYRGAVWSQPASNMVEDAVLHALEDSGKIAAVARQSSGIRADYKLVLDVRRFEADYAGQAVPSAVIEVNAKLLGTHNQNMVASRTFVQTRPADSEDIPDVVAAFEQSLSAMANDITHWTLQTGRTQR